MLAEATLTFLANSTAIEATEGDTVFVCAQVNVARSSAAGIASDFPVSLILNPLPSWPGIAMACSYCPTAALILKDT